MDVNEISKELGVPKSTAYRLISALVKYGYLEQDTQHRGYRLGIALFQMGSIVRFQMRIADIAHPFLEELRNITGETVVLHIIADNKVLVLRSVEAKHTLRTAFEEGLVTPFHAGASSRNLLAHLSSEEQDRIIAQGLPRFTENTITDPIVLKKELARIRELGFAYSDQELQIGARAISAPIRDFKGGVIAGISIVGPVHRFNEGNIEKFIPLIKEYSGKISQMMGFGVIQLPDQVKLMV